MGSLVVFPGTARAQSDGLYADFTTSLGSFTCSLDFTNAPKTVANFVGLASGQRAWLEVPTGRVLKSPFYKGLTFHRVIPGFVIQGGSPNGLGTDGPGYSFVDEFSPLLRHDGFGVLSMANSGPDSNGSQFFVTLGATAWLNDIHSVFGRVVSGSNVVYAIGQVSRNSSDKPLTNVVVQNIAIRAVGVSAQAFSVNAQGLPVVTNLAARISPAGTNFSVTFSNRLHAENRLYSSTNLINWSGGSLGFEADSAFINGVEVASSASNRFYHLTQVHYPDSRPMPRALVGKTMVLQFSTDPLVITNVFTNASSGSYSRVLSGSLGTGGITFYTWTPAPHRGRLSPIQFSSLVPMSLLLAPTNASGGVFSGTANIYAAPASQFSVSGSYSITP